MVKKLAIAIHNSPIASAIALLFSFFVPFIWVLSTGLIWTISARLLSNVSDTSISFPSGLPLLLVIVICWLSSFLIFQRTMWSARRVTLISNTIAIVAFSICFSAQFGMEEWNPAPDGWINIFPFRFALAVLIAYICSICATKYWSSTPKN